MNGRRVKKFVVCALLLAAFGTALGRSTQPVYAAPVDSSVVQAGSVTPGAIPGVVAFAQAVALSTRYWAPAVLQVASIGRLVNQAFSALFGSSAPSLTAPVPSNALD